MGILSAIFGRRRQKQETAQEMADRLNGEFRARLEREEKLPVLEDGTPNWVWYLLEANRLRGLRLHDQAEAVLKEGHELCARAGLDAAALEIKKKMRGTD